MDTCCCYEYRKHEQCYCKGLSFNYTNFVMAINICVKYDENITINVQ